MVTVLIHFGPLPLVTGGAQHGHVATPAAAAHHWGKAPPGVPPDPGKLD